MALTFNRKLESIRCIACALIIPPFETYISTTLKAFCLPCVEGILDDDEGLEPSSVERWQSAIADRRKVLQVERPTLPSDKQDRFYLRDYENGRELIDVSYLADVFDMQVQNKIGLPIVVTITEKGRIEHPEIVMESDGEF